MERTGWAFVALYLVFAAVLFGRASTCTGWVCDLVALPAAARMSPKGGEADGGS